jgi:hypothetical protein
MMHMTRLLTGLLIAVSAACGGGGGGATAPTPTPFTQTFTGSTTNRCTGDVHEFTAAEGAISVRLVETNDPNGALSVQVCAGNDTGNCSINQQKIALGQTINGTRTGLARQTLKLLAHSCTFGGQALDGPVTYRADVTYLK